MTISALREPTKALHLANRTPEALVVIRSRGIDRDGFPLDHSKSLISRYCGPGRNVASEPLIGVFSSEIDKCGPQWAGCYRDNTAAHLGFFADILNGFRVFYHYSLVRVCRNRAQKQSEHSDEKADQHCRICILASIDSCTIT